MKVVYKSKTAKRSQMKPKGNWEFQGRKVGVLSKESRSFLSPKSRCRKRRLREVNSMINFVDMGMADVQITPGPSSLGFAACYQRDARTQEGN